MSKRIVADHGLVFGRWKEATIVVVEFNIVWVVLAKSGDGEGGNKFHLNGLECRYAILFFLNTYLR